MKNTKNTKNTTHKHTHRNRNDCHAFAISRLVLHKIRTRTRIYLITFRNFAIFLGFFVQALSCLLLGGESVCHSCMTNGAQPLLHWLETTFINIVDLPFELRITRFFSESRVKLFVRQKQQCFGRLGRLNSWMDRDSRTMSACRMYIVVKK